jgi:hypothetical protein
MQALFGLGEGPSMNPIGAASPLVVVRVTTRPSTTQPAILVSSPMDRARLVRYLLFGAVPCR